MFLCYSCPFHKYNPLQIMLVLIYLTLYLFFLLH